MEVRKAAEADDHILVRHYLALWESYGTPADQIRADAERATLDFIRSARLNHDLGVYLAFVGTDCVGSVACQRHLSLYPAVVLPQYRDFGYVWSVFVEPEHRGRGIARHLMQHALAHLRAIGCTDAVLHSSDAGERLYRGLGFELAKEMRLKL